MFTEETLNPGTYQGPDPDQYELWRLVASSPKQLLPRSSASRESPLHIRKFEIMNIEDDRREKMFADTERYRGRRLKMWLLQPRGLNCYEKR